MNKEINKKVNHWKFVLFVDRVEGAISSFPNRLFDKKIGRISCIFMPYECPNNTMATQKHLGKDADS